LATDVVMGHRSTAGVHAMKFFNFHLMPYRHADLDAIERNGSAWVTFSNENYDAEKGAELYHEYLDQMELADRLGFDGVCLNEHHQTAYGMMPIPGVLAGALARSVKRGKLAILGRALPLLNNPLTVAEEYAMLDNLTRGRFIAGFVRGIGAEYHAMGINPTLSQERFGEAHDLIVRAWTEPGPFVYAGKHYHFNYVNPWPRPYQRPHPPIWIPSQGSSSTISWAAAMRYTYCQTLSPIATVARFFQMYREEADKSGYQASPDQLAWSNTIYVAETDAQALREARPHLEALVNRFLKMPTEMLLPPGYTNIESMKRVRAAKVTGKTMSIEDLVKTGVVIIGSPATVREKLAEYQDLAGFNTSLTKTQFGTLPDDMARANMTAIAEEILPHFRDRLPQGVRQAAAE
jgi:alkanesulfonate monooxygenase SsuD/methylene tetrahydromethanopterin reductase-like flavin-dependent oxidoreductase (luciferase family)